MFHKIVCPIDVEAAQLAARIAASHGAELDVVEGAWDRIVETIRADRAYDLVVVGTHGRTEKLVRHAPCSVLIARAGNGSFRHALCPIDFSEHSRAALEQAVDLANTLELVHVIDPPRMQPDVERRACMELDAMAAQIQRTPGVAIASDVRAGDPASEVLAMIDNDETIDLVAVGTHGRTGVQRALLGSVAEQIARRARCCVLVARRR